MANEILNSPILPGKPLAHDEHHHMRVLFVVIIILILILGVVYYFTATPTAAPPVQVPVVDQRMQAINDSLASVKNVPPATQAEIQASYRRIPKTAVRATQAEIDQSLNKLKAQQ